MYKNGEKIKVTDIAHDWKTFKDEVGLVVEVLPRSHFKYACVFGKNPFRFYFSEWELERVNEPDLVHPFID